jgi:hypothetical protein
MNAQENVPIVNDSVWSAPVTAPHLQRTQNAQQHSIQKLIGMEQKAGPRGSAHTDPAPHVARRR